MIVKSIPRKSVSFGQLLQYINRPEQTGRAILQNLCTTTDDLPSIEHEFVENSRLLPPRKNGNMLYHEILSFSDLDRDQATPKILEDLTRQYLGLRAPHALAYGKAHLDTDCPHVHLLLSANAVGSHRRLRLSRGRFSGIKRELEAYQREHYPFLKHSLVAGKERTRPGKSKTPTRRRAESERARRQQKQGQQVPARKDLVRQTVLEQLTTARSGEDFFHRLTAQGLHLYRRGQTVAVEHRSDGRRYRLRTLGLEESFQTAQKQWQAMPDRFRAIQDLELGRAQALWHELGFREDIRGVLEKKQPAEDRHRERDDHSHDPLSPSFSPSP